MTMLPRLLGSSGLTVTPLGLGLAALGRPGYINLGHAADLAHDYDVAAMEAQGTLPENLGDLRAAQEENRYSIQQSAAQVAGAETHIQNMTSLLALYYQGGIKTSQIAQLVYNLSGLVSLPVIAAK